MWEMGSEPFGDSPEDTPQASALLPTQDQALWSPSTAGYTGLFPQGTDSVQPGVRDEWLQLGDLSHQFPPGSGVGWLML